jgi:acyl carrier protein
VTIAGPLPARVWGHAVVRAGAGPTVLATVLVADDHGNPLAELADVELRSAPPGPAAGGAHRAELVARLRPLARDERVAVVTDWVVGELRGTLGRLADEYDHGLDPGALDPSAMLLEIGLDSLMITEFQRHVQEKLDFRFAAMESVEYQSIRDLAEYLLDHVLAP